MNTEAQKNVSGDPEPGQQRIPEQQQPRGQQRLPGLPARDAPVVIDDQAALALARRIVDVAADKKASDVLLLQISALTTIADYFVICSGGSERQLDAIASGITEALREDGQRPIGREGNAATHWVLLDYGAVIVHVFAPPEREFYQLERLWAEAPALLRIQ